MGRSGCSSPHLVVVGGTRQAGRCLRVPERAGGTGDLRRAVVHVSTERTAGGTRAHPSSGARHARAEDRRHVARAQRFVVEVGVGRHDAVRVKRARLRSRRRKIGVRGGHEWN